MEINLFKDYHYFDGLENTSVDSSVNKTREKADDILNYYMDNYIDNKYNLKGNTKELNSIVLENKKRRVFYYEDSLEKRYGNILKIVIKIESENKNKYYNYSLYFHYNKGKFVQNKSKEDDGSGERVDHLKLNAIEIFDKKWKNFTANNNLKNQILKIEKNLVVDVFNMRINEL